MSFRREDYQELMAIAKTLARERAGRVVDNCAARIYEMAENVIGQMDPHPIFPKKRGKHARHSD
jgi:hypothetical protein